MMSVPPTPPPAQLVEAMQKLWRLSQPMPHGVTQTPDFKELCDTCLALYGNNQWRLGLGLALGNAVRALGVPCELTRQDAAPALPLEHAAARLHAAFEAKTCHRVHLCPLDGADELPDVRFGPNRITKLSKDELLTIVDTERLRRFNPGWAFDTTRFSEFTWLLVEEEADLVPKVGKRAWPWADMNDNQLMSYYNIRPHDSKHDECVDRALLAMSLITWERWVVDAEVNWTPFHIPWVYTINSDIFVCPSPPPSPESLSWRQLESVDAYDTYVYEEPAVISMNGRQNILNQRLNDTFWDKLCRAIKSQLFETPVQYFFVRAFQSDGIDEFLSHILAMEAALGLRVDHCNNKRPKLEKNLHKKQGATYRIAVRASKLLGHKGFGRVFMKLHDYRNEYVHGRKMNEIPVKNRIQARRLARKTVEALVQAAQDLAEEQSREYYLNKLLDDGPPLDTEKTRLNS